MRRKSTSRAFVAGVIILAMLLSMTVLFGAQGPLAKITFPSAKARVQGVIEVRAEVNAADADYVVLVVDGDRPGSTNTLPASFELDTRVLADGPHRISVEAYDGFGLLGASKTITIYVKNSSGSVLTAKRPSGTRVAAKPASPATRVAAANAGPRALVTSEPAGGGAATARGAITMSPLGPARSAAGGASPGAPKTVAAAEHATAGAQASATLIGRGPTAEPTRTVAIRPVLPRSSGLAEAGSYTAAASGPNAVVSPGMKLAKTGSAGYRGHTVMLDGRPVEFDVVPVVKDGRIHGGFRALFGKLGGKVAWMSKTRTARSESQALTVEVPTGSRIARVNGADVDMGAKAEVHNGRTIVPVRFFAEATGSALQWDGATGVVHVRTPARALARASN